MVERLIQTIKRRLAVLDIDPNWSNTTLANRLANIIENIRLIPNTTTKISPFEAHFGRKPNTELSNITKASHKNLTYKNLTKYCLDKQLLKQNSLTMEEIWKRDEADLDIRYRSDSDDEGQQSPAPPNTTTTGNQGQPEVISSNDSENVPLALAPRTQKSPRKIYPSEIHFTIGDKTTKFIKTRKTKHKYLLQEKQKEPRHTLAPQWNIIQDGTITDYKPHTITIDTPLRKNTVIRKSDLAIVNEQKQIPEITTEKQKPRLKHMVACETVGEHKRNQEKINKFCLEEAKQHKKTGNAVQPIGEAKIHRPSSRNTRPRTQPTNWSPAKVRRVATQNQLKQQQKTKSPATPKKQNRSKQSESKKRPRTPRSSPGKIIEQRSKLMALQSSEEHELNRSFIQMDMNALQHSANTITYEVEESNTPQIIIASSDPKEFMITSPDSPPVQTCQDSTELITNTSPNLNYNRLTRRIDKAVNKIHKLNDNTAKFKNPQVIFLDADINQQNEEERVVNFQQEQEKLEKSRQT